MKALRFHKFGGPEVLEFEEIPIPEPGPGELLVKVSGAGVNPADWKIREGKYDVGGLPQTCCHEFSGVVHATGPAEMSFAIGDEVYGIAPGSCAEYVVAPAAATALKPPLMDLPDAGGVALAAMTAYQALFDVADIQPGQRVLILAASGGVGTFAVQLAKWKGAYVIATASAKNAHLVTELGADEVLDYKATPFETATSDIDAVVELVGGEETAKTLTVLKPGGIVVCLASPAPSEEAERRGVRAVRMSMTPQRKHLDHIAALIDDLKVRPVIDTVLPFNRALEAMKESESGHAVGKIIIQVS